MKRVFLLFLLFAAVRALAEIPPPDDAPKPLTPEESRKHFMVPEGFRIDLVAAEPLLADPSCVAWDDKGRMFVTEIHGYNLEGHLDVTELNKAGELDLRIQRFRVGPEMKKQAMKGQTGSLKLLRDTDGDGRMDEAVVWADDIPAAYGVVAARGGVIVTAAPLILFFADRDGDGKPEVREELFSGFKVGEMERGINNPVWGPDNWIYASQGWGGGTITGPHLKTAVAMGRTDFRFKPDGSAIEPASGSNHTFGQAFDDWGHRWLITTSQHARYAAPLPHRYLVRNPHVAAPGTTVGASNYGETFPISRPHPWRSKRGADPRWVKFYGANEARPNGRFTSACGQVIYRADLFAKEYYGNHFSCDPQQSMVHRCLIERDGPGLRVRRPEAQQRSEFLASSDGWFRPNNLRVGPDGALYIVDMYREIIEDYSAIPRYLQQQYGLLNGNDRGRIWRLAPADRPPVPLNIEGAGIPKQLAHANSWWRETAQRLLVESGGEADAHAIEVLAGDAGIPFSARIHALYTLDGLGRLKASHAVQALADPEPAVRVHGLRLGEPWLDRSPQLLEKTLSLTTRETDPNVLLQLALSLGESRDPKVPAALAALAVDHASVRWMENAVLSSIGRNAGSFVQALAGGKASAALIEAAARTAVRSGDLEGFRGALQKLAGHPDEALRSRLFALAAKHGVDADGKLREAADRALKTASDIVQPAEQRLAALKLLPYASPDAIPGVLDAVLAPREAPDFRDRAVREMLATPNKAVAQRLIAAVPGATPRSSMVMVDALLSHPVTVELLLAESWVSPRLFSSLQRERLLHHEVTSIRKAAGNLFSAAALDLKRDPGDDAAYFIALQTKPDAKRGAALYKLHCATCHTFGGEGMEVGPSLDGEAGRPGASLLADVLDPSAAITPGYGTWEIRTVSGATHAGVISVESATSLTLKQPGGGTSVVLRPDIASLRRLDISLMPAALKEVLKPDGLADVIAYIKSRPASGVQVLFDDDPGFPRALSEGRGRGELDWTDAAAGKACITVEGFQRYQRQLPGWNFPIREHPGEGEFRYLRLALKSRGAKGIMVEVAAGRNFPPNDQPVRTWYAGANSTGWKSNALSKELPEDWRYYTIDLWKGHGEYRLTGIALTVMGGRASYDGIELHREKPPGAAHTP